MSLVGMRDSVTVLRFTQTTDAEGFPVNSPVAATTVTGAMQITGGRQDQPPAVGRFGSSYEGTCTFDPGTDVREQDVLECNISGGGVVRMRVVAVRSNPLTLRVGLVREK